MKAFLIVGRERPPVLDVDGENIDKLVGAGEEGRKGEGPTVLRSLLCKGTAWEDAELVVRSPATPPIPLLLGPTEGKGDWSRVATVLLKGDPRPWSSLDEGVTVNLSTMVGGSISEAEA